MTKYRDLRGYRDESDWELRETIEEIERERVARELPRFDLRDLFLYRQTFKPKEYPDTKNFNENPPKNPVYERHRELAREMDDNYLRGYVMGVMHALSSDPLYKVDAYTEARFRVYEDELKSRVSIDDLDRKNK